MSRQISLEKIKSGTLTEDEERYLRERNRLPRDYQPANVDAEQSDEEVEEEELEDNYHEWTNDELREELGSRDLATHGNKSELVARLRANDRSE